MKVRSGQQACESMYELVSTGLPPKRLRLGQWEVQDVGVSGACVADAWMENITADNKSVIISLISNKPWEKVCDVVADMVAATTFNVTKTPGLHKKVVDRLPRVYKQWVRDSWRTMWEMVHRVERRGIAEKFATMTGALFEVTISPCLLC